MLPLAPPVKKHRKCRDLISVVATAVPKPHTRQTNRISPMNGNIDPKMAPLKEIRSTVDDIVLGPNRTENNGVILAANDVSPARAGAAFNDAALQRLQASTDNQLAQMRNESANQISQLTSQVGELTTLIARQSAPGNEPPPLPELTEDEQVQLEPIRGAVDKVGMTHAERAKREMLESTQRLIQESNAAHEARIERLEGQLTAERDVNTQRFNNDIVALGAKYGIHVPSLSSNGAWAQFVDRPVSEYQPSVLIKNMLAETSQTKDLTVWDRVFRDFSVANNGGNAPVTGLPNTGVTNQPGATQAQNNQFQNSAGQSGMGNGQAGDQTGGQNGLNAQGRASVDINNLAQAFDKVNRAREDLNRQLNQERTIDRETYATQMAELVQMDTELRRKYKELTSAA
jgi:hypothetical protein